MQDPTLGGDAGETTEVAVRVRFSEDKNFEPPQGSLEVIEVSTSKTSAPYPNLPDRYAQSFNAPTTLSAAGRLLYVCGTHMFNAVLS